MESQSQWAKWRNHFKTWRDAEYGLSCAHKHHRLSDKSADLSPTHFPHHTMEESKSRISEAPSGSECL